MFWGSPHILFGTCLNIRISSGLRVLRQLANSDPSNHQTIILQVKDRVESIRKVRFTKIEAGLRILEVRPEPQNIGTCRMSSASYPNVVTCVFLLILSHLHCLPLDQKPVAQKPNRGIKSFLVISETKLLLQ